MAKRKNHYEVLGVATMATTKDITSAFHALALKHHPDRHQKNKKRAEEKFKGISLAYDVLSNPGKRKNYDLSLRQGELPRSRPQPRPQTRTQRERPRPQRRREPERRRRAEERRDREPWPRRAGPTGYNVSPSSFGGAVGGVYSKTRPPDPHMRTGDVYSKTSKPPPGDCSCVRCRAERILHERGER